MRFLALAVALLLPTGPRISDSPPPTLLVEIRSYNLKPGTRAEFDHQVRETLPLLAKWKVDVVAYGPSAHDDNSYYLIRAFANLDARQRSEDAFYGSADWREGPRERVLALIESYTTVVLTLDAATVDGLRATMRR
jgi:hypothetical protein